MIAHNRPLVTEEDIEAVADVLRSGWLAAGPQTQGLEEDFVRYFDGGAACACSSGTAALFMALGGLGLGAGSRVAVPAYACSALLNAVHFVGGEAVPVDVRPDDFNLDPDGLSQLSKPVDAAIAVHTYGTPADIAAIKTMVPLVIEDCCQSLGGTRKGRPLGAEGDAAVFSFYATKIITCGQGGLVWDRTGRTAERARDFRDFDCQQNYKPRFNFFMTDFQAAMVRTQFARLRGILAKRQVIARNYLKVLDGRAALQKGAGDPERMPHRFVLILKSSEERNALGETFRVHGVKTLVPVQRYELLHRYLKMPPDDFPVAENLVDTTLSLPIYPGLSDREQETVISILDDFFA